MKKKVVEFFSLMHIGNNRKNIHPWKLPILQRHTGGDEVLQPLMGQQELGNSGFKDCFKELGEVIMVILKTLMEDIL